jgi:integrase
MRKPYFKKSRSTWYVTVGGKQISLGKDRDAAFAKWKEMQTPSNEVKARTAVQQFLNRPRKASTQRFYEAHLKLLWVGDLKVADLRPFHLTDVLDRYTGNYAHNIARAVKTCFKWLKETGRIEKSPFSDVKTPPSISRGEEAFLTDAQWDKILVRADDDLQSILVFLLKTGARPSEARHLEAKHLQDQCIVFPVDESKGNKTQRVIHLTDDVFHTIRCLALKYPDGPLFRRKGRPWTAQRLTSRCNRLGFQAYHARHSFATNAILRGVDLVTIASLMGHANIQMLSRIYSHIQKRDSHLREALQRATA